jgi:hypothetical protein
MSGCALPFIDPCCYLQVVVPLDKKRVDPDAVTLVEVSGWVMRGRVGGFDAHVCRICCWMLWDSGVAACLQLTCAVL